MDRSISGIIINPLGPDKFEVMMNGRIVWDEKGIILNVSNDSIYSNGTNIIIPGLIDLHTHLVQFPVIGIGKGKLLPWLEKYIYPQEIKFNAMDYSSKISKLFFDELIANGTTTAFLFTATNIETADIAFEYAGKAGIRAYIGNSWMDMNAPGELLYPVEYYRDSAIKMIGKWHGKNEGRLNYIVSPRYAGSCSEPLMQSASCIAEQHDLMIQTHLAENKDELGLIKSIFPNHKNYLDVYFSNGLVGSNTIFAHCLYLDESELKILAELGAGVAHCPTSNRFLGSGIMSAKHYIEMGLNIGMGTDIAGGYSLSVLNEAREAIENSKYLNHFSRGSENEISVENAFYLSTLGAAKTIGLDDKIGSLERTKEADFAVFDINIEDLESILKPEDLLSILLYKYPGKAKSVYSCGKLIYSQSSLKR